MLINWKKNIYEFSVHAASVGKICHFEVYWQYWWCCIINYISDHCFFSFNIVISKRCCSTRTANIAVFEIGDLAEMTLRCVVRQTNIEEAGILCSDKLMHVVETRPDKHLSTGRKIHFPCTFSFDCRFFRKHLYVLV